MQRDTDNKSDIDLSTIGFDISGIFILPVDWDVLASASDSCLDGHGFTGSVNKEIVNNLAASVTYRIWQDDLGELGTVEIRKLRDGFSQIEISGVDMNAVDTARMWLKDSEEWETKVNDAIGRIHRDETDAMPGFPRDEAIKEYVRVSNDRDKAKAKILAKQKNHQADVIRGYASRLLQEPIWTTKNPPQFLCNFVDAKEIERIWPFVSSVTKDQTAVQIDSAKLSESKETDDKISVRDILAVSQKSMPLGLLLYKVAKDIIAMSPDGIMPDIETLSSTQRFSRLIMSYACSLAMPKPKDDSVKLNYSEDFKLGFFDLILPKFAADFLRQFPAPSLAKAKFPRLIYLSDFLSTDTLITTEQILDLSVEEAKMLITAKPLVMDLKNRYDAKQAEKPQEPHEQNAEKVTVLSERTESLNKLAVLWVNYNQTQRISKSDDMKWFIDEHAESVGLSYITVNEFKRHLPKAYRANVIDKDKKTRRFIPKSRT